MSSSVSNVPVGVGVPVGDLFFSSNWKSLTGTPTPTGTLETEKVRSGILQLLQVHVQGKTF